MWPLALKPGNSHPGASPTMSGLGRKRWPCIGRRLRIAANAGGNAISGPVRVTENPAVEPSTPGCGWVSMKVRRREFDDAAQLDAVEQHQGAGRADVVGEVVVVYAPIQQAPTCLFAQGEVDFRGPAGGARSVCRPTVAFERPNGGSRPDPLGGSRRHRARGRRRPGSRRTTLCAAGSKCGPEREDGCTATGPRGC